LKAVRRVDQFYLLKQLSKTTALLCKNGILVDASSSWIDIFGLPPQNSDHHTKVFPLYAGIPDLKKKLKENKSFSLRHKISNHNGTGHFKSYFAPWFDEKENVIGTIIQTDNITAEVEKEHQVEWLQNILETKVEVSKTGWWEFEIATEQLTWCKETKRIHHVPD